MQPEPAAADAGAARRGFWVRGWGLKREAWSTVAGWACLAGLAAFGLLFASALFDRRFVVGDEGQAVMNAWRIGLGEVPYRDFFEGITPLSFYVTALAFRLLGTTLTTERLLVALYAVLLVVLADRLLVRLTPSLLARLAVASFLIPLGVFAWTVPSHHWLVDLLQLAALLALLSGLQPPGSRRWAAVAGTLAALACLTMQDQGGYFVLGVSVLFLPWVSPRPLRRRLLEGWLGGLGVVTLLAALHLVPRVGLGPLWEQWVRFPMARYGLVEGNQSDMLGILARFATPAWRASLAAAPVFTIAYSGLVLFLFALPFACLAVLVTAGFGRWTCLPRLGLLAAGCAAWVGGCAHRYTLVNLIWGAALPLVVVAWGLGRLARESAGWRRWAGQGAAVLLTILSVAYAAGILERVKAEGFVAIRGSGGVLWALRGSEEESFREVVEAVERLVPRDGFLFCTGYHPLLNFWTQRRNPTRFNFLLGSNTEAQVEEVAARLQAAPDTYVLLFGSQVGPARVRQVLASRYRAVWNGRTAALLEPVP